MSLTVFTYGTLQIPEVMEAVTGERFQSIKVTAHGFVRYTLQGKIYPGIMVEPGASTDGCMYVDVSDRALTILDEFEGEVYERRLIDICLSKSKCVKAYAYVIPQNASYVLSDEAWRMEDFLKKHLRDYVQSCRAFHLQVAL